MTRKQKIYLINIFNDAMFFIKMGVCMCIYDYMYIFDHLSDDADRIRETQSEKVVLLISSTFRYTMLCNHIKHYTAGIDYNQDFYIYIYI